MAPIVEEIPVVSEHEDALEETTNSWRKWSEQCTYQGKSRAVMRSLITLKSLTHWPSGGIVAAATTSLPEQIGASEIGTTDSVGFVIRRSHLRRSTVAGISRRPSASGTGSSAPSPVIRLRCRSCMESVESGTDRDHDRLACRLRELGAGSVGNAASDQFQLDVYGEVMDAQEYGRDKGIDANGRRGACNCNSPTSSRSTGVILTMAYGRSEAAAKHFTHPR